MLTVIADDITGAAEIAGIAHRYGLHTILSVDGMPRLCPPPVSSPGSSCSSSGSSSGSSSAIRHQKASLLHNDTPLHEQPSSPAVLVIATDTRSMTPDEALAHTASIAKEAAPHSAIIFHKTDSALRGHVMEEIHAIIDTTPYTAAIYLPANPSKGRMIHGGTYYIATKPLTEPHTATATDGATTLDKTAIPAGAVPISSTAFSYDPEFPALTSSVRERFSATPYRHTLSVTAMPDAVSRRDIDAVVGSLLASHAERTTLLAGAADLFTSLIEHLYALTPCAPKPFGGLTAGIGAGNTVVIVRGSTQSTAAGPALDTETMPDDVFNEERRPELWAAEAAQRYASRHAARGGCIVEIGSKPVRKGRHAAVYLRNAMAEAVTQMLSATPPDELVIEGGATAYAIISRSSMTSFRITDEIAPGVVRMISQDSLTSALTPESGALGSESCSEPSASDTSSCSEPSASDTSSGSEPSASDASSPLTSDNRQTAITLKPGSYEWGNIWKKDTTAPL